MRLSHKSVVAISYPSTASYSRLPLHVPGKGPRSWGLAQRGASPLTITSWIGNQNAVIKDAGRGSVNRGALRAIFTAVFRLPQARGG